MPDSQRIIDTNGWIEIPAQPLSKAGVFPYLGHNIPGAPNPALFYNVFRSPESLSDQSFMASLRLMPWVDEHGVQMLGPEELGKLPAEQKGVGGVIGEQIYYDTEDNTLYGNVKVFSEALKNVIDSKPELSLGYYSQYVWQEGVYEGQPYQVVQIPRYGNHLASVRDGRMGPTVAVLDHSHTNEGNNMVAKVKKIVVAIREGVDMKKGIRKVMLRMPNAKQSLAFNVPTFDAEDSEASTETESEGDAAPAKGEMTVDDAMAAWAALLPILEKFGIVTPDAPSAASTPATDPSAVAATTDEPDDPATTVATMDAAEMMRTISADLRKDMAAAARLVAKLTPIVGTFDAAEMTEQQVAEYGIAKLKLSCAKGSELSYLTGYLAHQPVSQPVVLAGTTDAADTIAPFWSSQLEDKA